MWARSSALRSSYFERRMMTSLRCLMNRSIISRSDSSLGLPSTRARLITPKLACSWVWAKSWFRITLGTMPLRSSMTMRMPWRSDSSRRSLIPSILRSLTRSAMRTIRVALLTW